MILHFWKYLFYLLLILFLFLQTSISFSKEVAQSKPIKLKVVSAPYISNAPFFIAEEEGYFSEQGLQIEFIQMIEPNVVIPSLIKGDLDVMGEMIQPSQLNAIARGAGIKIVADKGYLASTGCTDNALMARRTLVEEKKLDRLSQLKGRRVAMNQPSSSGGYFMETILSQAGLTLDDVEKVFIPVPSRVEAFGKGTLDLTIVPEPWVTLMLQTTHAVVWIPINQIAPDFQLATLMYGPTLLEKNPKAGKRFMVAYLKAVRQYNQGKIERNLKMIAKHTQLDQELLKRTCWPALRNDGKINIESVLDFQAWAVKRGFLDKAVTTNQFWDPSFIEYANKVLDSAKK
jgi:NitT/TauT family transport system substrate-binding protein